MPAFLRYIGIDYSGAETPTSSLRGLRVYLAEGDMAPREFHPPPSPRRYWTRRGIAEWLLERLAEETPTLVGIDHGFSFPLRYFEAHMLAADWPAFLEDFRRHWPTDGDHMYVDFVRDGLYGNGAARAGNTRWRRLTEQRAGRAKSVFHFDVQGSVAKSTHSGIPWLLFLRERLGAGIHFWPFDGWEIPAGRSAVVEAYPSLWSRGFAAADRTADQHDAYSIAAWLSRADGDGSLGLYLKPELSPAEQAVARVEGWILGVTGAPATSNESGREHLPRTSRSAGRRSVGRVTISRRVGRSRQMSANPHDDPVLARFRGALEDMYGSRMDRVVLFGSRARGEAHADSDYDIAVFLKDMPDRWTELHKLADLRTRFLEETGAFFDAKPYAADAYNAPSPLMHEVRREGVVV